MQHTIDDVYKFAEAKFRYAKFKVHHERGSSIGAPAVKSDNLIDAAITRKQCKIEHVSIIH